MNSHSLQSSSMRFTSLLLRCCSLYFASTRAAICWSISQAQHNKVSTTSSQTTLFLPFLLLVSLRQRLLFLRNPSALSSRFASRVFCAMRCISGSDEVDRFPCPKISRHIRHSGTIGGNRGFHVPERRHTRYGTAEHPTCGGCNVPE